MSLPPTVSFLTDLNLTHTIMENKDEKLTHYEKETRNTVNNFGVSVGAYTGGSMCNPMYRNIHADGNHIDVSGRGKKRYWKRLDGETLCKRKKFWEL